MWTPNKDAYLMQWLANGSLSEHWMVTLDWKENGEMIELTWFTRNTPKMDKLPLIAQALFGFCGAKPRVQVQLQPVRSLPDRLKYLYECMGYDEATDLDEEHIISV